MRRRLPAAVAIVALLVTAGLVDHRLDRADGGFRSSWAARRRSTVASAPTAMPTTAVAGALSSTWYCAGGTAFEGSAADMTVVIVNPGARAEQADVTVVPTVGPSRRTSAAVPAAGQARILVRTLVDAPDAAVQVDVPGGAVAVEREVTGPDGFDTGPCTPHVSPTWYLAAGSTLRGADETIAVFNPFPADTAVDIDFATDSGPRQPRSLQAIPVKGRSVLIRKITGIVTRRRLLATRVRARSGRIVVARIQVFDGTGDPVGGGGGAGDAASPAPTPPPRGLTVTTGVPAPQPAWVFPAGRKGPGRREQVVVYNPSDADAEVDVAIALDDPATNGTLDPFPLSVPSGEVRSFDVTDAPTVPDVDHSITVRTANGVDVVAETVLTEGEPAPHVGVGTLPGSPLVASTWLFGAGGAPPGSADELVLRNTTGRGANVRVEARGGDVAAPAAEVGLFVPARGRATVPLGPLARPGSALVVRADSPIVAERVVELTGRPGVALAMGVPEAAGARPVVER